MAGKFGLSYNYWPVIITALIGTGMHTTAQIHVYLAFK